MTIYVIYHHKNIYAPNIYIFQSRVNRLPIMIAGDPLGLILPGLWYDFVSEPN